MEATQFPRKQQLLVGSQTLPVYPSVKSSFEQEGDSGNICGIIAIGENESICYRNLHQLHFVGHQSHMDWPIFESGLPVRSMSLSLYNIWKFCSFHTVNRPYARIDISISIYIYIYLYLSISIISIYIYISISIYRYIYICIHVPCIHVSLYPLSMYPCSHVSIYPYILLSIYLHIYIYLSIYLYLSVCLSI